MLKITLLTLGLAVAGLAAAPRPAEAAPLAGAASLAGAVPLADIAPGAGVETVQYGYGYGRRPFYGPKPGYNPPGFGFRGRHFGHRGYGYGRGYGHRRGPYGRGYGYGRRGYY